jgi:hypothetical protein
MSVSKRHGAPAAGGATAVSGGGSRNWQPMSHEVGVVAGMPVAAGAAANVQPSAVAAVGRASSTSGAKPCSTASGSRSVWRPKTRSDARSRAGRSASAAGS